MRPLADTRTDLSGDDMDLDSLQRMIGEPGQRDWPTLVHVIAHAPRWCRGADPLWFAERVVPRFLDATSLPPLGALATSLARAVADLSGARRETLESRLFESLERGHNGSMFAAEFGYLVATDRERLRRALDRLAPAAEEDADTALFLRALSASNEEELRRICVEAHERYRRAPSRGAAGVMALSPALGNPWSESEIRSLQGSRFSDFHEYLRARVAFGACAPADLLVDLRAALGALPQAHRAVSIVGFASGVPSAEVPALMVEQLNRWARDGVGLAYAAEAVLGATLAPHLGSWESALAGLDDAVLSHLHSVASGSLEARRLLEFFGRLEPAGLGHARAEVPSRTRRAGPLDPWDLADDGSFDIPQITLDERSSHQAVELALRSSGYFAREAAAEALRRVAPAVLDSQVSQWTRSESPRERGLAGELAPWTSCPVSHVDALRWDDSPMVREGCMAASSRRQELEAVERAFAIVDGAAGEGERARALHSLTSRAFSVHVRRGATVRARSGLRDLFASSAIGAIAQLEVYPHVRAWWPDVLVERREEDPATGAAMMVTQVGTQCREYLLLRPAEPEHAFRAAEIGGAGPLELVDLAGDDMTSSVRQCGPLGWRTVAVRPGLALLGLGK